MRAVADVIIPDAEGMPAATQVGVPEKWIDRVLKARPDLYQPLTDALGMLAGADDVEAALIDLNRQHPETCAQLILAVTGAYYLHPRVRKLYGYPGQKPNPAYRDESDHYLCDGILDPVVARGPLFRPTPSGS
jgi:hypothetical protein